MAQETVGARVAGSLRAALAIIGLIVGMAVVAPRAAADPATVCAPANDAWQRAAAGTDQAAMRAAIGQIPKVCTQLLAHAKARLSAVRAEGAARGEEQAAQREHGAREARRAESEAGRERELSAAAADDAAYAIARTTGTDAALSAYLNAYPGGRHVSEAEAMERAIEPPVQPGLPWVALASTETASGRYGYASGADSSSASRSALSYCANAACKVLFAVQAHCVGYADSASGGYWYGYAYGPDQASTGQAALQYCNTSNGVPPGSCTLERTWCADG